MRRLLSILFVVAVTGVPAFAGPRAATVATQFGTARRMQTPEGSQLVLSRKLYNGQVTHQIVSKDGGQVSFGKVFAPLRTGYGMTTLVAKNGKLEHRIDIGGLSYRVTQRPDGRFEYSYGQKTYLDVVGDEKEIRLNNGGTAQRLRLGSGEQKFVYQTEIGGRKRYYEVDPQTQAYRELPPLSTGYGVAEIVAARGKLEQRVHLGEEQYLVARQSDGQLTYTGKDGTVHVGVIRRGTTILTTNGPAPLMRTSEGELNVLTLDRHGAKRYYAVTPNGAMLAMRELGSLAMPYGRTTLVASRGKLENKIEINGKPYVVAQQPGGHFTYTGKDGTVHVDAVREGTTIVTAHGPAPLVRTSDGDKNVLTIEQGGGKRYYEVGAANSLSEIRPLRTPYGNTELVVARGRMTQRITIAGATFSVERKDGGFVYVDKAGERHVGAVRVGRSLLTPWGKTTPYKTRDGQRDVLVGKDAWGRPTYRVVSSAGGQLTYRDLQPLRTPYGVTEMKLGKNTLEQDLVVEGKHYTVSDLPNGGFEYADDAGNVHVGAIRVRGGLLTPQGRTRRFESFDGPLDVLGEAGGYQVVRVAEGKLTIEALRGIDTPYGKSRVEVADKRVEHWVDIDGKRYRVERRGEKLAYVDGRGKEYRDDWVDRLTSSKPAPNTVKRLLVKNAAPLPDGPIVAINGTQHMAKATYEQLRDAMIETMEMYPPQKHYFIGLGSDPHPIIAFLQNVGGKGLATNFPASGKYNHGLDPAVLAPYVRKLIPPEVLNGTKTLVLLDQTNSGASREGTLAQISRVFEAYLQSIGSPAKIEKLAYSPVAQPAGTGRIDTTKYPEVGKFLKPPYEHVVSQYDRHVLGQNTPQQLIERPQYEAFKGAMKQRMERDEKLDALLAKYAPN